MATIDMALGGVEKIIKVASEIKKAVETAKRNREEVVDIQERVETVEHIVLVLDETDVTTNLSMERALENLHRALHRALELVQDCEKRNRVCLLCAAKDVSQKLLRVQDDISHKLMQVTLAITVHITMELGKKQANPPSRRRRRPVCRVPHRPQDQLQQTATAIQTNVRVRRKNPDLSIGLQDEGRPQRKFGDWDAHPASAERYMGRFNKLRDDKKMTDPRVGTLSASAFRNNSGAGDGVHRPDFKSNSDGYTYTPCLKKFSLSELNFATNNFSDDRVIGKGGYSIVYKGVFHDGHVVALKVLLDSYLADTQSRLLDEVNIGAKLRHKNVVRQLGYCMDVSTELVEKRTHLLVLDHLPNGSLGDVVKGEKLIEWSSCFRIIRDIAQGVHYLHEQRVIHGDLKPDNILFDTHTNPVIIDFGKSIILDPDVDEEMLDHPVGTLGYMAPETYESCRLSMKSDVFAFGVCLVRTVIFLSTGRRDWYDAQEWKRTLRKAGGMKGLLLPMLQADKSQLMDINRYLEVGWLCTDMDPAKRPTMADVVKMLSGEKQPPAKEKNNRGKARRP